LPEKSAGPYVHTNNTLFLDDLFKEPYKQSFNAQVKGSPFLNDNWQSADLFLTNGQEFHNLMVKLNLYTHELVYLNKSGGEVTLLDGIIERCTISNKDADGNLSQKRYISALKGTGGDKENSFFESITQGKANLLLLTKKKIENKNNALSPGDDKEFVTVETYYLWLNGQLYECEKNAGFYVSLFKDQKDKIQDYISSNKLKCRKIDDIKKLSEYYNTL
jgi:hypothetical protein